MITSAEMKKLEQENLQSVDELMAKAAKGVVEHLQDARDTEGKRILVACYHGNKGGDGLAMAQLLSNTAEVDVLFLGDEEKMSKAARKHFDEVNNNPLVQFTSIEEDFDDYDIIVDALVGLSLHGPLRPDILNAVKKINKTKAFKLSVDIPTGIHADSGEISEEAISSDLIVTFHDIKPGIEKFKDKTRIVDIGL